MGIVGYIVNTKDYERHNVFGSVYSYILAGNGVFVKAENKFTAFQIQIADVDIRGLTPLESYVCLVFGQIPATLFYLAAAKIRENKEKEVYLVITYGQDVKGEGDLKYRLFLPPQRGEEGKVKYSCMDNVVLNIHSHPGGLSAHFSPTDDKDDQGLQLSMVIGNLDKDEPRLNIRAGVYGYFYPVQWMDIFDRFLTGYSDVNEGRRGLGCQIEPDIQGEPVEIRPPCEIKKGNQ
ncbi:MAG: hypothetical protein PHF95_05890 [bacterium]|nr:hypothetical protein [bacterium]